MLPSWQRYFQSCRRVYMVSRHLTSMTGTGSISACNPSVGIIIVGDEILKGHVSDTNSHFLCKRLFSLGVKVQKISVIPDDLDIIAKEVAEFSNVYTHVITSGGIGPTHDDLTFEGVARAFKEKTHFHPELVQVIKEYFGTDDMKSPKFKLAQIPESSQLHYGVDQNSGQRNKYPLVNVRNVYIFPGVPNLMERAFIQLENLFRNPDAAFHVQEVYIQEDEVSITPVLNELDEKFHNRVTLGSYPDFHNSYYKVKLTLESENVSYVEESVNFLHANLPQGSIIDYERDPISKASNNIYDLVDSTEDSCLITNTRNAVNVIEECLQKYSLDQVCVGFNGGKDCTAVLHLVHAVLKRKYPDQKGKLKVMYIRRGSPFPEVELFIKKCIQRYDLEMININGRIKDGLREMKRTHPGIEAVVMGTRRSDPHSDHLSSFMMTDPDWPQYMRVNPILDWNYSDVWAFIRKLSLPYCSLYDTGYTSLGSMENTHPNPELQITDDKGSISYRPAHQLVDSQSERAGRN